MVNRRKFLKQSTLLSSSIAAILQAKGQKKTGPKAISIATWAAGKKVTEESWKALQKTGNALDAVEAGARFMENQQDCCVGLGAMPDRDGIVTLDAAIMNHDGKVGAVAALERIKHPISVARKVMELTPHVILAGHGAQQFALENDFTLEPAELSKHAAEEYQKWKIESKYQPTINIENKQNNHGPFAPQYLSDGSLNHDTMALITHDGRNIAAGVTTSGMGFKMRGRVGDSPITGAGYFVDGDVGAAVSSGLGEEVIKSCGSFMVVEFMRQGYSPEMACKKVIERIVKNAKKRGLAPNKYQIGFIAIDKNGNHGAYAIQKGFEYAVKTDSKHILLPSKHLI